jgi:peptidyl-prolyl cis-trans isomerase SurA
MKSFRIFGLYVALGVFAAFAWLAPSEGLAAQAAVVDRIVAVINEDIVTLYDIETMLRPMLQNMKKQGLPPERERQMTANLREEILNNLINAKLTEQEIKRYNINVTEEEIDHQIRQVKERRSLSDEGLKAGLAQEGLSLEDFRKQIKLQIQRTKLVNREVRSKVVISQEDIKAYYEKNMAKYGGGTQYYLWNLFIKLPPQATAEERKNAQASLQEALEEVQQGRPFEDLVRRSVTSPKGFQGTELGLFRLEELTPQLREVVRSLKSGQVSPIIQSDFGYQILYVQQLTETAAKPMAQVEAEIQDILFREYVDSRFNMWLADLRKRSHIKIMAAP